MRSVTTKFYRTLGLVTLSILGGLVVSAQKRMMDHEDFATWKHIRQVKVSADGQWVSWRVEPGEGDGILQLYNTNSEQLTSIERAGGATFTWDGHYLVCRVTPSGDSLKTLRRSGVDKEELPGDTLCILDLRTQQQVRIPNLQDVHIPEEWSGYLAFTIKPDTPGQADADTTHQVKDKNPVYSDKSGYPLLAYHLQSGTADTLDYVTHVALAAEGPGIAAISRGRDSVLSAGVYRFDFARRSWQVTRRQQGEYEHLTFSTGGGSLAFIGDTDTTNSRIRPFQIYLWTVDRDSAYAFITPGSEFLPEGWQISNTAHLQFSEDNPRLFFGVTPPPLLPDTSLLDEERVEVEVWHYLDERMYTQQNVLAKREKERSYLACANLAGGTPVMIADEELPESSMDRARNSPFVVLYDIRPYLREMSWTNLTRRDVYIYDLGANEKRLVARAVDATPALSPGFHYLYWYNRTDSLWHIVGTADLQEVTTTAVPAPLYDEMNDRPQDPGAYGSAGWTTHDSLLLVYDRYDIWAVDPQKADSPLRLTTGRASRTKYRYSKLDPDEKAVDPDKPAFLYTFNEDSKATGYAMLDIQTGHVDQLIEKAMRLRSTPIKAKDEDLMVFTEETFQIFPDLHVTTDWFRSQKQISHANPQQGAYYWGDAELFHWKTYDGRMNAGVLVKPEGFKPARKYPVIVNFYERSSDNLYQHRTPAPHRSTINYSFYASRGYVIFNPDVHYTTGHPGQSAYNAVVSGVEALIDAGFVDPERIGVQGHSWGGYQVAYLITKTNIFACAEAGAPVVNMVSAYGGIRWQTGLSRMFQYERTQSRLGKSLWEAPELYLENSPIFDLDKVNTPVLILHNDHDGHVPWYQGIEFFTAMRRLGKPAWMLNYNDEPHWPTKLALRKDFNIRMQQFFDHYLMDAPLPLWMQRGLPATQKGILQNRELITD